MIKVDFLTSDNVKVVGSWLEASEPKLAALMLHMMPATKESWEPLQKELQAMGISSLAIDERGHGESIFKGSEKIDFHFFNDREQKEKYLDIEAALAWLALKGFPEDKIIVIGASIGANLTLQTLASRHKLPMGVLFSAGKNYRGIQAKPLAEKLNSNQKLMLFCADDDANDCRTAHLEIQRSAKARVELTEYEHGGHGTSLLSSQPGLIERLKNWIATNGPSESGE